LYLIAFDLAGVLVSSFFDVAPLRGKSGLLFYAIWFVCGAFCGLLSFDRAGRTVSPAGEGDWTSREDSGKTGNLVILATVCVLTALTAVFFLLWWRRSTEPNYFVPESPTLTALYFVTVFCSTVLANTVLLPSPKRTD
jgi:hypothetical protein